MEGINFASVAAGQYTQQGAADRLISEYGDVLRFCRDTEQWYMFDEETFLWIHIEEYTVYSLITTTIANKVMAGLAALTGDELKDATKFAKSLQALYTARAAVELAKTDLSCMQADFDARDDLAALPGGKVYDALNDKIIEGSSEYMITRCLGGTPKESVSERFNHYIEVFLPDEETRRYLQVYLGSCLLGLTYRNPSDKKALFCDSLGHTGKSMFLHVLKRAFGSYYETAKNKLITEKIPDSNKPNPILAKLRGAKCVGISEFEKASVFAMANFKNLTGGDELVVRGLFEKNPFTFRPNFRLLIMSNALPTPDVDDDLAFRRRFRRIRRDKPLSEIDETLEIAKNEQSFIDDAVTWLAEGCRMYRALSGRIDNYDGNNLNECNLPVAMKAAIRDYIGQTDDMFEFFSSCYIRSANAKDHVFLTNIYEAWLEYTNEKRVNFNGFCRLLRPLLKRLGLQEGREYTNDDVPRRLKCVYGIRTLRRKDACEDEAKKNGGRIQMIS